jgi:hypothetical protein
MSKGVDELARDHGPRAVELLADVMETAVEDRDRIRAAEAILDRGYGKPSQAIIAIPANRRQAALLAGMSDEQLVAVIEQKQLPRLSPAQPMVTIASASRTSSHGPAAEAYATDLDPLLA